MSSPSSVEENKNHSFIHTSEMRQVDKSTKRLDHILIAVDDSAPSTYAVEWALNNIVSPAKHVVYLLSVAKINPQASMIYSAGVGGGIPWTMLEEINRESLDEAKRCVLNHHESIKKTHPNIEIHSLVGQGDPRDEIVDAVSRVHADLLILGSRGLGALKRAFLGSTGDYCTHHAPCSVMIVKKKTPETEEHK